MEEKFSLIQNREFSVSVENITFRLLVGADQKGADKDTAALHKHVSAELFSCGSGKLELATEAGSLVLSAGDIAVIPPGIDHCMIITDGTEDFSVFSFICDKRGDRGGIDLFSLIESLIGAKTISVYRDRGELCDEISEIIGMSRKMSGIIPALRSVELLVSIASDTDVERMGGLKKPERSDKKYDIQRMMLLDSIIVNCYMKDIKMSEIAEKLYISGRQLDRIVRRRYGMTLHKVIMETRVRAAEHMLLTTDKTADRIGRDVGFSSNSGFYREFTRVHGVTPSEYRKKRDKISENTIVKSKVL